MVKIYVGMCSKFSTNISTKFIMIKFLVRFFFSFEQKINNIVEVLSVVHLTVSFNFFQM